MRRGQSRRDGTIITTTLSASSSSSSSGPAAAVIDVIINSTTKKELKWVWEEMGDDGCAGSRARRTRAPK
jgi:hypothetical protein